MTIESSPLYDDLLELIDKGETKAFYKWTCTITSSTEEITPISVDGLKISRDYQENYTDLIILDLTMNAGDYNFKLFPDKNNLIITLIREVVSPKGETLLESDTLETFRYRGTLMDGWSPSVQNYGGVSDDYDTLEHANTIPVSLQLTSSFVDIAKQTTFNGIFHEADVKTVLQTILSASLADPNIQSDLIGVDIVDPNNLKIYDHIIIPPGSTVVDLPDVVQKGYGVYSSGIGSYIQNNIWYIYPLFRTNLFNESVRKATAVSVPESSFMGADLTYNFEDNQLYLLAIGQTQLSDEKDALSRNIGNGVVYQNAARVIDLYSTKSEGTVTVDKDLNILKYITYDREDGQDFTPFYNGISSSNHCLPSEGIAITRCSILSLVWHNGDADLIKPGMPLRYVYQEGEDLALLYGVIIGVEFLSESKEPGILNDVHSNRIIVNALVHT